MRDLAREISQWILTTYSLNRTDLKRFWIEDMRPGFYNWAHVYWQKTDNSIGDVEVYQVTPPAYTGGAVQAPAVAAAAISLGIDTVYWYEENIAASVPADGDIVDDGISIYSDNWVDRGQNEPRPQPNRGDMRVNRFRLQFPFYIPRTVELDYYARFVEQALFAMENDILAASPLVQRQILKELCREKTLIVGGYETTPELTELLLNNRQILSLRGTPHAIVSTANNTSEVDRLFNASDAEYSFIDGRWIMDVTYPDQVYHPGQYAVSFDLGDYIKVSVTNNNMTNYSIERAVDIIQRYLIPAEYPLIIDFK